MVERNILLHKRPEPNGSHSRSQDKTERFGFVCLFVTDCCIWEDWLKSSTGSKTYLEKPASRLPTYRSTCRS